MTKLEVENRGSYVVKLLKEMKKQGITESDIYYDPMNGDLYDQDNGALLSITIEWYPMYDTINDEYMGDCEENIMLTKNEAIAFWG